MAKTPKAAPEAAAPPAAEAEAATEVKSIVNPKYRGKYTADQKDWLSKFLDDNASKTKEVKVTVKAEDGEGTVTKTEKRPDGVDVDAIFALGKANGLTLTKYEDQRNHHGFPGRFRMTVANSLRRIIRERHGIFNAGGTFMKAPAEMLTKVGASEKPTHNQDGTKIVPPKVEAPATPPAADAAPAEAAPAKAAAKK